ncbi:MAG: hypothetical protein ACP5T4_01950 [Candidatus Micrarchaeia archaeon]
MDYFAYLFVAIALAVLAYSVYYRSALLIFAVSILLLAGSVYSVAGKYINAIALAYMGRRAKYQQEHYMLSQNLASAVKRQDNAYAAIAAVSIVFTKQVNSSQIGSILLSRDFDFDYTVSIRHIDAKKYVEGLETKKRLKELELAKCDSKKYAKINELKKEIQAIESDIGKIQGSRPVSINVLVKAIAKDTSPYVASKNVLENAESIANAFSEISGASCEILKGEELLEAVS